MHFSSAFRCFLATKKKYYQQSRWRRVIQNIFVQKKVSNVTFQARTTHTHSHKYCKETPQQHTQINWVEIDNDRNRKYKNIFIFFQWMSTFSFFGILCHDSFYSTLYCHWFGNITVNTHTHTIHTHFIDDVDPISNTPANRQQQRKYIYISHIRICNNICCFFFLFFIRMKFTIFRLNNSERNKKKNKQNEQRMWLHQQQCMKIDRFCCGYYCHCVTCNVDTRAQWHSNSSNISSGRQYHNVPETGHFMPIWPTEIIRLSPAALASIILSVLSYCYTYCVHEYAVFFLLFVCCLVTGSLATISRQFSTYFFIVVPTQ